MTPLRRHLGDGTVDRLRAALGMLLATMMVAAPASGQRLIVLASGDSPLFAHALAGIESRFPELGVEREQLTATNATAIGRLLGRIPRDAMLVTLGTPAAELAARLAPAMPFVGCMVGSSDAIKGATNAIAVPIDAPPELQTAWLAKLLPAARAIGLLFDPAFNARRVDVLAAALTRAGYAPLLLPVTAPTELPAALERLPNVVDAVLAIPDPTVYAHQAAKALLLFSFRHGIPLIGPSEAWVRAGALYAVSWNYRELGAYCAALAQRQLAGGRGIPPAGVPARVAVNLRSAAMFGLEWNTELLRGIDRSYD